MDQRTNTVYIAGETFANGLHTIKAYQSVLMGTSDAFALAVDPAGTSLLYSTYLGGDGPDFATVIRFDPLTQSTYVGGVSHYPVAGSDFKGFSNRKACPPDAYSCQNSYDGFVIKLGPPSVIPGQPSGDLLAATLIGGVQVQNPLTNATGDAHLTNVYVTSPTGSSLSGFDKYVGPAFLNTVGGQPSGVTTDILGNVYVAVALSGGVGTTVQKFDLSGQLLTRSFPIIPANVSGPFNLAVDAVGNLYVAALGSDAILKLNTQGALTSLATIRGPRGIAFYPAGVLYVVGSATATAPNGAMYTITDLNTPNQTPPIAFPTGLADPQAATLDSGGYLYVSKRNGGGANGYIGKYSLKNGVVDTRTFTVYKSGLNGPNGLGFDRNGNFYVTDLSTVVHYFPDQSMDKATAINGLAALAVSNAPGYAYPFDSRVLGITVDPLGKVFVSGYTSCKDIPTAKAIQPTNAGGEDAMILKFDSNLSLPPLFSTYFGGTGDDWAEGMASDINGGIYVIGYTTQPTSLTGGFPTTNSFPRNYAGGLYDAFVIKLANADIAVSNGTLTSVFKPLTSASSTKPSAQAATSASRTYNWQTSVINQTSSGGGDEAENASASMTCPALATCTCSASTGTCSVTSNAITVQGGKLAAGAKIDVNVQIQVDPSYPNGTPINFSMTGRSDTNDPNTANNTGSPGVYQVGPLMIFQTAGTNIPAGLQLTVDGVSYAAPFSGPTDPGRTHTFCANAQPLNGVPYAFVSWNNGAGFTSSSPCWTASLPGGSPVTYTATFSSTIPQTCPTATIAFVTSLYQDLLDRAPDSGGMNFYCNGIANGSISKPQAAAQFFTSPNSPAPAYT